MKLNLEFYKNNTEDFATEEEKEIIQKYLKEYPKEKFTEILEQNTTLENVLALSSMRENILSWYTFKKDAKILEIGANLGEITGLLCNKAKKVVATEPSKIKAEAIAKRYEEKENLEVIVGNLEEIEFQEKFDYILLIGILEKKNQDDKQILEIVKSLLLEDGTILLAMDNKLRAKISFENR